MSWVATLFQGASDKFSHYLEKTRAAQPCLAASGGGDLTTVTQHQIRQQGLGKDRQRIHTEVRIPRKLPCETISSHKHGARFR